MRPARKIAGNEKYEDTPRAGGCIDSFRVFSSGSTSGVY